MRAAILALTHEIINTGLYDRPFLARYTNAGYLIDMDPASDSHGLPISSGEGRQHDNPYFEHDEMWWDRVGNAPVANHTEGTDPALAGGAESGITSTG